MLLARDGIDVHKAGDGGMTPLHSAALNGNLAVAQLLSVYGVHQKGSPRLPSGSLPSPVGPRFGLLLDAGCTKMLHCCSGKEGSTQTTQLQLLSRT